MLRLPPPTDGEPEFPVFVPPGWLAKIPAGDLDHPLLRQVLPTRQTEESQRFQRDPVGDAQAEVVPGLLHKYPHRALWLVTAVCPVHCRYCFRQHFDYQQSVFNESRAEAVYRWLDQHEDVTEVLLSGGDPLCLPDSRLQSIVHRLAAVPHLRRLRFHTRMPVMIPQRIDDRFVELLRSTRLVPWVVIHANHVLEIDDAVATALTQLVDAGVPVLNQAVLLRGVNDSVAAMADLCERLVNLRVQPYYLHQLDPVAGAADFEVPVAEGRQLIESLRARLPGYAVPQFVQELPGETSKTPL